MYIFKIVFSENEEWDVNSSVYAHLKITSFWSYLTDKLVSKKFLDSKSFFLKTLKVSFLWLLASIIADWNI